MPSTILLQKSVLEKGKIENKRIQTTATIARYFNHLFIRVSYRISLSYYPVSADRPAIIPLNPGNVKHYFNENLNIKKAERIIKWTVIVLTVHFMIHVIILWILSVI